MTWQPFPRPADPPRSFIMTPSEIVHKLNKHIIGQNAAKRAVAIALRNRWRRQQVGEPLRQEITPKNVLMIGPTFVGKSEIARRLARLADAPVIEVSVLPAQMEILAPPGMEDLTSQIQGMFQQMSGGRSKVKRLKVGEAMKALIDEEAVKLVNDDDLKAKALANVAQNGIVFLY